MDTSETYIKMCEKAEIQADKPIPSIQVVDEKLVDDWKMVYFDEGYLIDNMGNWWADTRPDTTWLPRQDQLQEMIPTTMSSTQLNFKMISELNHFYDYWDTNGIPNHLTTWEQLWLAFVMKEKYNKV